MALKLVPFLKFLISLHQGTAVSRNCMRKISRTHASCTNTQSLDVHCKWLFLKQISTKKKKLFRGPFVHCLQNAAKAAIDLFLHALIVICIWEENWQMSSQCLKLSLHSFHICHQLSFWRLEKALPLPDRPSEVSKFSSLCRAILHICKYASKNLLWLHLIRPTSVCPHVRFFSAVEAIWIKIRGMFLYELGILQF